MENRLDEIINTIENDEFKKLAEAMVETIPPYFFEVGASSTGKYHPEYSLGDGGLMRHTIALVRIMNHMFEVMPNFQSTDRDIMRIAGMMHDTRKSGNQEDFLNNKYTKHEHPLLAAEVVRTFKGKGYCDDFSIELIANAIESHMGKWNTSNKSSIVLPIPTNKFQNMVHLCDYLASRKDLILLFDDSFQPKIDPMNVKMPFGKYKGNELKNIPLDYINWCLQNMDNLNDNLRKAMEEIIK